jgi:hypothetical protein
MQQRYYDSIAGKFLSVDPVTTDANTGSAFGRYHYAENNPYAFIDPTGMTSELPEHVKRLSAASDKFSGIGGSVSSTTGSSMGSASSSSGGPGLRVSLANVSNFAAGVGDTLTFGATAQVRDWLDIGSVDSSSTAYGAGQATGVGVGVTTGGAGLRAVAGPLKQWVRIGPSYSKAAGTHVEMSIRWGASPAAGGKYLQQIPSKTMRDFNQWLRAQRLPVGGWRAADPGHFHLW